MPLSDTQSRSGDTQSPESQKETRDAETEEKIENIWKEVNKDVEWLSQNPPGEGRNPRNEQKEKMGFGRLFRGGDAKKGKVNQDLKPPSKRESEKDETQDDGKDPTAKILAIVSNVGFGSKLATHDKSEKHVKLRNTLTNTIKCIITLGERAAGAASQVRGSNLSKSRSWCQGSSI